MKLTFKVVEIHPYISSDYIKKTLLNLRATGMSVLVAGLVACGGGGGGGTATAIPNINVNPSLVSFGSVIVGSNAIQTVTVSNSGNATLTLGTITLPAAPFSVLGGSCTSGQTLAANASCTIILQFTPTTAVTANGSFNVPSNDPDAGTANGQNNVLVSLSGSGTAPPVSTTTYLHYTSVPTSASVAGTLTTIDPDAPATTTNTNPALVGDSAQVAGYRVASVDTGTISAGTLSNARRYAVVFSSGGVLKKQSAVVGTSVPTAVQISSASGITSGPGDGTVNAEANDLCEIGTFPDFQTPDSSGVFYGLAGTDKTCGSTDDAYSWLRLNTPAGTAPTPVTGLIGYPVPIYNTSTGAITGFVALNTSGALTKFDANVANPVGATNGAGPFIALQALVDATANGHMLLLVGNSIRTYDPASNALGTTDLATISQPYLFNYTYDATNFYFVDNPLPDYTTNVIQRISLTTTAPAAATPVVTEAAGARIGYLNFGGSTPNRLVYTMTSGTDNSVQSIVRTAANATPSTRLYPATANTDPVWLTGSTSTGRVYISRFGASGATAVVTNDDATGLVPHADAWWNAGFTDTTSSLFGNSPYLSQVVLLQRNAAGKITDDGATLTAYDAAAHTAGAALGSVPADIFFMSGGWAFDGPRALLTGYRSGYVETDIFYVNVLSAGSLTRATNDAASEELVY